jgi:hypothetical protein
MRKSLGFALALLLGALPSAWAQVSAGNIYGTVTDESGAVLPGATVTLTGETIGTRTTTAGTQGDFRFLNLDPGGYKLSVALTGFGTVNRTVTVTAGVNVNLSFGLKVATVEEAITVTAETPAIDPKKTGTSTTLDRQELHDIPNSRDPWAVLRAVPGVLVDRVNTAGTESGQQSGYVGKGSVQQDSSWTLDGVTITDPGAAGSSPTYFDFDAFDEVNVTTGGADIRAATGGVGLNLVTKRGTNSFHGSVGGFFSHDDLQSTNLPAELVGDPRLKGSDNADHAQQIADYGADLGGPVIKDKLWFWGSYGKQDLRIVRLNQVPDKTILKDYSGKVNWQVTPSNMFSVFYFNGVKEKFGRPVNTSGATDTQPHTRDQGNAYPGWLHGFGKVEDNHVFGPNFVMNLKYAYYGSGFSLTPEGGVNQDERVNTITSFSYGSSNYYKSVRPTHNANADFNYFATGLGGNHEFKFGFGYRKASVTSTNAPSGSKVRAVISRNLGPNAIIQRDSISAYEGSYTDGYLGDTFTKDRLTVNLGVRYDHQKANNKASSVGANPLFPQILPALTYDGTGQGVTWNDFSPRAAVSYALDQSRKTLMRVSYARFVGQLPFSDATVDSPVGGVGQRTFKWTDLNGDGFVQQNEVDLTKELALPQNATLSTVNKVDPNYSASHDDEIIAGIDRELAPNFALSASYTYRHSTGLPWMPYIGVNNTDWVAIPPTTVNGYTAIAFAPGPTNLAALNANSGGQIIQNRPGYSRSFNGVELTALKRLSNKWMARVAFSYNDWKEHFDGTAGIQDPTPTIYDLYGNSNYGQTVVTDAKKDGGQLAVYSTGSGTFYWVSAKWQVSASALYQLPAGFEIAGNFYGRQGYPRPINITVDNVLNDTALAVPNVDTQRLEDIWNLDLRLAKNMTLSGNLRLGLTADAFNVFNSSTILRRVDAADSAALNRINQVINPRLIRFGMRLTF